MQLLKTPLLLASILALGSSALKADVTLSNIFGDHMVLQREQANPVWGKADAGEQVTVSIGGQSHQTTANKQGIWRVKLDPMEASDQPQLLQVSGLKNQVSLADVLVGEVWMASGQSNMQWMVAKSKCLKLAAELTAETEGKVAPIREFQVSSVTSQLHPIEKATGSWKNGNYSD